MQATNEECFMLGSLHDVVTFFFKKGIYPAAHQVITATGLHHS